MKRLFISLGIFVAIPTITMSIVGLVFLFLRLCIFLTRGHDVIAAILLTSVIMGLIAAVGNYID